MSQMTTKLFEYGRTEIDHLKLADRKLGLAIERLGQVERTVFPDLFASLIHAVVGQLISAKAVHTIWNRMEQRLGAITPGNLAILSADDIQSCGLTMKKATCIHALATQIAQGAFSLEELRYLPDEAVIEALVKQHGVGRWTAEMVLIHGLERPDVVSWGDIAIRRGMMKLYGLDRLTKAQFDDCRHRYSPYGSVASIYLWQIAFE